MKPSRRPDRKAKKTAVNKEFRTVQIPQAMADEIDKIATAMGRRRGVSWIVQQACRAILDMAGKEEKRVPRLVRLIEATREQPLLNSVVDQIVKESSDPLDGGSE